MVRREENVQFPVWLTARRQHAHNWALAKDGTREQSLDGGTIVAANTLLAAYQQPIWAGLLAMVVVFYFLDAMKTMASWYEGVLDKIIDETLGFDPSEKREDCKDGSCR